ncbi:sugar phosphate isomerase/epimerase family protein [Corynebacterium sp. A21]|uniref:sugar phosphate isomerase/epimerase family protein n=1 Tax=Corynebacterium sp. A21 TaxID=3457318 RepID=UPI003FD4FE5B
MTHRVYNMDACFYNPLGIYSFEAQLEMLQDIGFDGAYLALWTPQAYRDLDKISSVQDKYGLEMAGVYAMPDLAKGEHHPDNQRILQMLERLEGCSTVEIAVRTTGRGIGPSDPAGDAAAIRWLNKALKIAERRGIDLLLYSHLTFWMETHDDALRLARVIDHPNLGIVFCGPHWYATGGGDIHATLKAISPYLRQANLSGARRHPLGFAGVSTVEPLDRGELDNFAMLGALKAVGFDGWIGFENWEWGSDIYNKLKRSLQVFRDMETRVEQHPQWPLLQQ